MDLSIDDRDVLSSMGDSLQHMPRNMDLSSGKRACSKGGRPKAGIWEYFVTVSGPRGKSNRFTVRCRLCNTQMMSRVDAMEKHIAYSCKSATFATKDSILQRLADKTIQGGSFLSKKKPLIAAALRQHSVYSSHSKIAKMSNDQKKRCDLGLLKLFVMHNIPFRVADSHWFLSWLKSVQPNYKPSSSFNLRGSLLQEVERADIALQDEFSISRHACLTLDGWMNSNKHHVFCYLVAFPNRHIYLLKMEEYPNETLTGEFISGKIMEVLMEYGPSNFIALITNDAGNIVKESKNITSDSRFKHIFTIRCLMHAFNLCIGSILGHPWARLVVTHAQRLVTCLQAHPHSLALLKGIAKKGEVSNALSASNTTEFTSIHTCLALVLKNEGPLKALVQRYPECISSLRWRDITSIVMSSDFWADLGALCKLLVPLPQVIQTIQSRRANLADMLRHFLCLKRCVKDSTNLPNSYREHWIQALNRRWEEIDDPLVHLTFFLHPLYKHASEKHNLFPELCQTVLNRRWEEIDEPLVHLSFFLHPLYNHASKKHNLFPELWQTAVEIWKLRGYGPQRASFLIHQLQSYRLGDPPFELSSSSSSSSLTFSPVSWWRSIVSNEVQDLPALACLVFDILPHASPPERTCNYMGWYHSKESKKGLPRSVEMITKMQLFYDTQSHTSLKFETRGVDGNIEDYEDESSDLRVADPEELSMVLESFYNNDMLHAFHIDFSDLLCCTRYELSDPIFSPNTEEMNTELVQDDLGTYIGPDYDALDLVTSILKNK